MNVNLSQNFTTSLAWLYAEYSRRNLQKDRDSFYPRQPTCSTFHTLGFLSPLSSAAHKLNEKTAHTSCQGIPAFWYTLVVGRHQPECIPFHLFWLSALSQNLLFRLLRAWSTSWTPPCATQPISHSVHLPALANGHLLPVQWTFLHWTRTVAQYLTLIFPSAPFFHIDWTGRSSIRTSSFSSSHYKYVTWILNNTTCTQ